MDNALIHIVDDNEVNRQFLEDFIREMGCDVMFSENGYDAMEAIKKKLPDLMLLDIMMPDMNGIEVLESLKDHYSLYRFPVIVISAVDEMSNIVKCIELGAEDFFIKPFHPVLLKARIKNALEKKFKRDHELLIFEKLAESFETLNQLQEARANLNRKIIHDLNSPLSSIKGYSQYLSWKTQKSPDKNEELQSNLDRIGEASFDMEVLIQSLIDVSKFESTKFDINSSQINVFSFLKDQISNFLQKKTESFDIDLLCEDASLCIEADQNILSRVIQNLLATSIKYLNEKEKITLSTKTNESNDNIMIKIQYNGIPIPAQEVDKIFNKSTSQKKTRKKYGIGLGLYFCKIGIEAMDGRIWAENEENEKGSAFFIEFKIRNF